MILYIFLSQQRKKKNMWHMTEIKETGGQYIIIIKKLYYIVNI